MRMGVPAMTLFPVVMRMIVMMRVPQTSPRPLRPIPARLAVPTSQLPRLHAKNSRHDKKKH